MQQSPIWVLLAVLLAPNLFAQGRLGEFLGVKGWKGKIDVKGSDSGTVNAPGSGTWSVSWDVTFNVVLDQYSAGGQFWTGTIIGDGKISHRLVTDLGGCRKTDTLIGAGPVVGPLPTNAFILFAGPGNTYSFSNVTKITGQGVSVLDAGCDGRLAGPPIPIAYWPDALGRLDPLPFPATGLTLSSSSAYAMPFPFFVGLLDANLLPKPKVTVTWLLEPLGVDELVVDVSSAAYDTWLPSASHGGSAGGPASPGTGIELTAELKNKDGSTPAARAVRFLWELTDVSREPGIAINWPPSGAPGREPDLRFEPGAAQLSQSQEKITMETRPGQYLTDKAMVLPLDWGAWGVLKVTAFLTDGRQIVGKFKTTGDQDIRLPKRLASSFIADLWKQEAGVSLPDADDGENSPEGDSNRGDGLTLYEEYRGFYENGGHKFGHPKVKDYFIRNRAGGAALGGIVLFKRISGLDVNLELQENEIDGDRVVNFLHDRGPHNVDQHAVIVSVNPAIAGYAEAVSSSGHPDTPKNILFVQIPAVFPGRRTARAGVGYGDAAVAHELLHACNVYHHGEEDVTVKTWTRNPDTGAVLEDGAAIVPILEQSGQAVGFRLTLPDDFGIGIKRGTHSGDDGCVMRYDNAVAYVSDDLPDVRYLAREVAGVGLCSSGKGSGVNETPRVPQSRYGDARRGNCLHQILVNDRVPAPGR